MFDFLKELFQAVLDFLGWLTESVLGWLLDVVLWFVELLKVAGVWLWDIGVHFLQDTLVWAWENHIGFVSTTIENILVSLTDQWGEAGQFLYNTYGFAHTFFDVNLVLGILVTCIGVELLIVVAKIMVKLAPTVY